MNSEQFAYWLQGFVELNGSEPTAEQWQSIKDHLKTVFVKVTPEVKITTDPAKLSDYPKLLDAIRRGGHTGYPWGIGKEPVVTC